MGMLGQHRDSTAARAQHGDSMGMLGQHGDSTAARAQHGDSMEAARQPELSMETAWGCWVSMETALRKDRQGGISFFEEKGKKKEEGRISGFVCCVCVLLCYCYIFYCLFFLRYYPIFLRRLSLFTPDTLVWHPTARTTTTTGRVR